MAAKAAIHASIGIRHVEGARNRQAGYHRVAGHR
jgi:hypothetical protein